MDATVDIYKVKDWEKHYEGSKTKTYNNKTTCSMPNKHGLGYRKLIRSKDGPALFGAWCSLLQILSKHEKPRHGYCTDTGGVHGIPYSFDDLEMMTDIPASLFGSLFLVAESIGWVEVISVKDTTGSAQGYHRLPQYPLNSDSDSDLNSDLDSSLGTEDKPPALEEEPIKASEVPNKVPRFTPPTVEEVAAYIKGRGSRINPEMFVDFYASKGWLVGKSKMKDWKACVRTWENRDSTEKKQDDNGGCPYV